LGRYGGINANSSSGMMTFDIPVYELASANLKLPVSLSYNSCGIRVDEIGSPGNVMGAECRRRYKPYSIWP
jgi:hypothetical protein